VNILIVGAGIFGTTIAAELAERGHNITLVEKGAQMMDGASRVNHNRVHFGYHYPRSLETAQQCLESIPSFLMHYGDAVVSGFPNYYAIARDGSFVSPQQYVDFCKAAKIDFWEEYPSGNLLRKDKLAACFRVREPIFDTLKLRELVKQRLVDAGVKVLVYTSPTRAKKMDEGGYTVMLNEQRYTFDKVINASYSGLNEVNRVFNIRPLELRFESAVVPVFNFEHAPVGLTVMDGPYCTIMPRGNNRNEFLLWHVDGSVLSHSMKAGNLKDKTSCVDEETIASRIMSMSEEFMPFMPDVSFHSLMRTTKTVYENKYDARVSEVNTYSNDPDFISVLSGKIMCAPQISYKIRELLRGKKYERSILV